MSLDRKRAEELLIDLNAESVEADLHLEHKHKQESIYGAVRFILEQMIQKDDEEKLNNPPDLSNSSGFLRND